MDKINLIILLLCLDIVITVHVLHQMRTVKQDTANIWEQVHILVKTVARKLGEIKVLDYIKENKNNENE
jgi:hypothetical protein